jgi:Protein of unknown function (DUF1552)
MMRRVAKQPSFGRRAVLKSASGVALALPFLESLAWAEEPVPVKRFVGLYIPNGVFTPNWFPVNVKSETEFSLNSTHTALSSLREYVLWFSKIDSSVALTGAGEQHQRGLGAMLTGAKLNTGNFVGNDGSTAGWANGQSLDQALVPLIASDTRVKSLQMGAAAKERDVSGALSYEAANRPLLPQNDPRQIFKKLFMDSGVPTEKLDALQQKRRSILDSVLLSFNALRDKVTAAERLRLDQHASRVRELEKRLTSSTNTPGACRVPNTPPDPTSTYETTEADSKLSGKAGMQLAAELHRELLVTGFTCDVTRIATVMFSDAKNHIGMPFLDVAGDVHNISHYGDSDPARLALAKRDVWAIEWLAGFMSALASIPEGSKTALDNTTIFLGSDVSRGNVHSHDDMPFLLAGRGSGFKMGRYLRPAASAQLNSLLLSIFRAHGATVDSFGDANFSRGPLAGL